MAVYPLEQIRRIESRARAEGLDLMARAGRAAAEFIAERYEPAAHVLVLAGPGNNGGDALVAATYLLRQGYTVQVVMASDPDDLPTDAAASYGIWRAAGGVEDRAMPIGAPDVAIDGLFGIGLSRPLGQPWQSMVDTLNEWRVPVLALDLPSGLNARDGQPLGRPVIATWTLAFIAVPSALAVPPACMGETHLADLGLDAPWLSQALLI